MKNADPIDTGFVAFTAGQRAALVDFWDVYDTHYDRVQGDVLGVARRHREFGPLVQAMPSEHLADQGRKLRDLLRDAIVGGRWERYLAAIREQGATYAALGVSVSAWHEVARGLQQALIPLLIGSYGGNPDRLARAITAMMELIDRAMAIIAEQYVETEEDERFRLLLDAGRG